MNLSHGVGLILVVLLSYTSEARPKDPRRERARCDTMQRLCKDVAGIDYRNCVKARQDNCTSDYQEDVSSCNSDHQTCLSRI